MNILHPVFCFFFLTKTSGLVEVKQEPLVISKKKDQVLQERIRILQNNIRSDNKFKNRIYHILLR